MSDAQHTSHGTQPPTSPKGHLLPRRSSPGNSITLRNHRLAREASAKEASLRAAAAASSGSSSSPHRQSSGGSHNTGPSDPKKWFDQNNQNPKDLHSHGMDADPPFFQRANNSSNEDRAQTTRYPTYLRPPVPGLQKPSITHSSSADDYRSVIDDLTVEIKRLRDELKRYKQKGPDMMKQDRLFEIKVHGLPKRKKRELESTLRDFASGLESSAPSAEASAAKRSRHTTRLEFGYGSASKHASSSSGSHSRPVDSAYASMSTGAHSSGTWLTRPSISSRTKSSEQKVENYLKDIPEGLYPRNMILTDKDKKKLIVRRLEQIFTGQIRGRQLGRTSNQNLPNCSGNIASYAPIMVEPTTGNTTTKHEPSIFTAHEASREARILPAEEMKHISKDTGSMSNSNGDQPDSGGNSAVTGASPTDPPLPEQRPTRPLDLDPDRKQNPSANMDYIGHLGLDRPPLTGLATHEDVSRDADGWVYLNLLCNMAQLHMLNVAPNYIRSALAEKSTKFQLSPDGRKIRWRGGTEGTRFSSDSSGDVSQTSRSEASDGEAHDEHSKKRKRNQTCKSGLDSSSGALKSSDPSRINQHMSSADSFHYKPIFVHHSSSAEQTSLDDSNSSYDVGEGSNNGESRWGNSGSGSARRKRRRLDGAIIYYSGAPFCMDLSGDPGDSSSYLTSTGQDQVLVSLPASEPRPPRRTDSGSVLAYRPLAEGTKAPSVAVATEAGSDGIEMEIEADFLWSNDSQQGTTWTSKLDACGLGGVVPDDHFVVFASTKRPKMDILSPDPNTPMSKLNEIAYKINKMACPSGLPLQVELAEIQSKIRTPISIEYTSRCVEKLNPAPLPPPGMYYSLDSDSSESSDDVDGGDDLSELEEKSTTSAGACGIRVQPPAFENHYPDLEMSSGDEEGVEPDDEDELMDETDEESSQDHKIPIQPGEVRRASNRSIMAAAGAATGRSQDCSYEPPRKSGSSAATAGGAGSGYSSGSEM